MNIISARNISRSYGDIRALDDFSLDIDEGEIVALLGPDGAGKTSFIRILCNLITPDSKGNPKITINGRDALREFASLKTLIGYMPQTFSLYPDLSVEENMIFSAGIYGFTGEAYRRMRDRMYEFSNLGPFAERRAGALSGGMKQKLALSCSLLHDPRIMILDEPTTGVDPLSRRQFWEMLLDLNGQGVTILVSTPYMDEVARADRAVAMLDGRTLTEAGPEEMAASFEGRIYYLHRQPAIELVDRLSAIKGLKARRFGSGLHLYTAEETDIEKVSAALREAGVDPERLERIDPSIEDRFIQLMEEKS
jgi:ABC-type multidrug transport system ATPase subunit